MDEDGFAQLRVNAPGASPLQASYRVGTGSAGNVVAEAINAIVSGGASDSDPATAGTDALSAVRAVRNPLPASGGVDAEDAADARLAIPGCFEDHQPRALIAQDYAKLAATVPGVRRAAAELRFTGSLIVADVAVQPSLGEDPQLALLTTVEATLAEVRRVGHVVRVHPPRYRPLLITLAFRLRRARSAPMPPTSWRRYSATAGWPMGVRVCSAPSTSASDRACTRVP